MQKERTNERKNLLFAKQVSRQTTQDDLGIGRGRYRIGSDTLLGKWRVRCGCGLCVVDGALNVRIDIYRHRYIIERSICFLVILRFFLRQNTFCVGSERSHSHPLPFFTYYLSIRVKTNERRGNGPHNPWVSQIRK